MATTIPAKYRPVAYAVGIGALIAILSKWGSAIKARLPTMAPKFPLDPNPPTDVQVSPNERAAHQWARPIVTAALRSLLGREPTLAEIQYGQAVGWLETSYGRGWKKPPQKCIDQGMPIDYAGAQASNNWGAVHATGSQPSFKWCDSKPNGEVYAQAFRVYPSPEEGAKDKLRHTFVLRKAVAKAVTGPQATVWRASFAMRRGMYYGSWCNKAVAQYGASVGGVTAQRELALAKTVPEASEGILACEKEAATLHADTAFKIIRKIAASLNEPVAMPLGDYEDAIEWYRREIMGVANA